MTTKITSRIEGFTGPSTFGNAVLKFEDGVAEVDELSDGLRTYLERKGYTIEDSAEDLIGGGDDDQHIAPATTPAGTTSSAPGTQTVPKLAEVSAELSHQELDAVAKERGFEFPAGNLNKKEKADLLNEAAAAQREGAES